MREFLLGGGWVWVEGGEMFIVVVGDEPRPDVWGAGSCGECWWGRGPNAPSSVEGEGRGP